MILKRAIRILVFEENFSVINPWPVGGYNPPFICSAQDYLMSQASGQQILRERVLSFIAEMLLPWWSITIVAFAVGFTKTPAGWKSFWAGFLGVGFYGG